MAAPDQTTLQFGAQNSSGDRTALFLKKYAGEVLVAYSAETKTEGRFQQRVIDNGKSAQFPHTHVLTASYHTPGTYITGQASNANEKVIAIDGLLIAPSFIANIDEAMTHYEVRSIYANEAGVALAQVADKQRLQVAVNGARASAIVSGGNGGTQLTSSGTLYKTSATDLAAGIFAAVQTLAEKNVPESAARQVFVKPAQYYLLAQAVNLINKDWGGQGAYADGKIVRIAGAEIVMTNNLPTTNISGSVAAKYDGDFTKTAAVLCTPMSVATVKLMDLAVEMEYKIELQGTLLVAKYAMGHDFLRPDCSVELKTTS